MTRVGWAGTRLHGRQKAAGMNLVAVGWHPMRQAVFVFALGALLTNLAGCIYRQHLQAASVLARITADGGAPSPDWFLGPVRERDLRLELSGQQVAARLYLPAAADEAPEGGLLLLHGVHPQGIHEPRFVAFGRALAAAGIAVLTPSLPELATYRIEAGTIGRIASLARWHAGFLGRRRVGAIGISFAGGLALMAAAREGRRTAIGYVVAVGAHHDLARLGRYYAGADVFGPEGQRCPGQPHPYGIRILAHAHAEHFFEPQDVPAARRALRLFLDGDSDAAHHLAAAMGAEGRARMEDLLHRYRYRRLEQPLLAAIGNSRAQLAEASPKGQLAGLSVPVYLVHGLDDPVIPSIETRWLAQELAGRVPLKTLITPMLRHTEHAVQATEQDRVQLVHLMAQILQRAQQTP